jgi:tRNA(adenine34) deaminase
MDLDEHFMRIALQLGEESLSEGFLPVGAVVVSGGVIIGKGRKRIGPDPYFEHAEIQAMRAGLRKHPNQPLTLYSTLEPCIMCFGTALHAPFHRVVFALEDPGAGATGLDRASLPSRHQNRYPDLRGGVLRDEAILMVRRFLKTTTNRHWQKQTTPLVALVCGTAPAKAPS